VPPNGTEIYNILFVPFVKKTPALSSSNKSLSPNPNWKNSPTKTKPNTTNNQ
jgi:hypothetical protein